MKLKLKTVIATITLSCSAIAVVFHSSHIFGNQQVLGAYNAADSSEITAIKVTYNPANTSTNNYLFIYKQITNYDSKAKNKIGWRQVGVLMPSTSSKPKTVDTKINLSTTTNNAVFIDPPSSNTTYKIAQALIKLGGTDKNQVESLQWIGLCTFNTQSLTDGKPLTCGNNKDFANYDDSNSPYAHKVAA